MSDPHETAAACSIARLAFVLCVGCGGLAVDGPSVLSDAADGEDLYTPLLSLPEATTAQTGAGGSAGAGASEGRASSAASGAGASHVGEPCGQHGAESDGSVIVGDVELRHDPRCEAERSCLLRTSGSRACESGSTSTSADCAAAAEAPFVPVPPPAAPEAAWQGGVCTCRCDGSSMRRADYCVCPAGMSCRALIPSAGVNAAARQYVGSYCAY